MSILPNLDRGPLRPSLPVLGDVALPLARLHEACGPARHMLAMLIAAATRGPVLWIAPPWQAGALNPDGIEAFTGPERFIWITPEREVDILWTLEEALRSGAAPFVVADLPGPPGLTPVRRLHLAAETGAGAGKAMGLEPPLGLILTPGAGGAPGIETRWHMAPAHRPGAPGWTLTRARARTAPPATWHVSGTPEGLRMTASALG
ncbi:ImuA family protein [Roseovarius aquimarinus]|uniref:ImuA family protein n=1 Tax=Roseovarius aquimarinus TaxID=1229156 RepID=A0ABW7I955_9RHOB